VYASDGWLGNVNVPWTSGEIVLNRARASYTIAPSQISADNRVTLQFKYHSQSTGGIGATDWFELFYARSFRSSGDALHFWSPRVGLCKSSMV
jgi:hypothetical protein